ncbi:HNH endonuclease [Rhodovulum sp. BSW8]|uniref:HNH endonuclease n=1 Tax=Rhodovulum sp. BSW8 TaxID=2259645 RepID=UPI000DE45B81|nr:HNH endonuclease signature motif containing protein [Rhodovulum sp. BSW8]RBO52972.1 HNH endonuclease [Rhodovulum sp. BSW8]
MAGQWRDRPSASERGYGRGWKALRKRVMQRDSWLCQPCLRTGRVTPATECDHVVPKAQGGTDDEGNLQAICADCHKAKTEREAAEARGRRLRPSFGADGWLIGPE